MIKSFNPSIEKIEPTRDSVFRFLGMGKTSKPSAKTLELFTITLKIFRKQIDPKGIIKEISNPEFAEVYAGSGKNEPDAPLGKIYPKAEHLALYIFTLGEKISQSISSLFASRDFAMGSMLDAIASRSADMASGIAEQKFFHFLESDYRIRSSTTVLIYSPGYCGWHISAQKKLFEYLEPEKIGITLSQQFLMVPLKSITGVLVAGKRDIHIFKNNFSFCRLCSHKSCLQRIKPLIQEDKEIKHGNIKSNLTAFADGR
jgi:hypothetical protein